MSHDPIVREAARDWLVTGQEARFEAWLAAFTVAARLADPWLLLLEGAWHRHACRHPEAALCLERAAALFEDAADAQGRFAAAVDLIGLAHDRQDGEALAAWAARAGRLVDAGDPLDRAEYWHNRACAELAAGRTAEAEALWQRVLDLPRFGSVLIGSIQQFAAINMGVMSLERTELEEAARRFRKALALAERTPLRPSVPFGARLYLARIAYLQGDAQEAIDALAALPGPPDGYRAAEADLFRAEAYLALGDLVAGEAHVQRSITRFDEFGARTPDVGLALATLARVRSRQGRAAEAQAQVDQALGLAGGWPQYRAAVLLARADVEDAQAQAPTSPGEPCSTATRREALALARKAGSTYYAAWAALRLGGADAEAALAEVARVGCWGLRGEGAFLTPATAAPTPAVPGTAPAEPGLTILALGQVEIRRDGERLDRWPRRKARVLLLALLLRPEGYPKEDLADLLSPDLEAGDAEHQLDNIASSLRKILEPGLPAKEASRFLEVRDRRYRLRPGAYGSDLQAFEAAVMEAAAAGRRGDGAARRTHLVRAIERYRGDLAAEPFFLPFFALEREHYRQRFAAASLAVAADHQAAGRFEEAQATWERLLEVDPACEESHEGLIALFESHRRPSLAALQRRRRVEALAQLGLGPTQGPVSRGR